MISVLVVLLALSIATNCTRNAQALNTLNEVNAALIVVPPKNICDECMQTLVPFVVYQDSLGLKPVILDYGVLYNTSEVFPNVPTISATIPEPENLFLKSQNYGVWFKNNGKWISLTHDQILDYESGDWH
jgi:hypothetical protein